MIETNFVWSATAGDIAIVSSVMFIVFLLWLGVFIGLFLRGKND